MQSCHWSDEGFVGISRWDWRGGGVCKIFACRVTDVFRPLRARERERIRIERKKEEERP